MKKIFVVILNFNGKDNTLVCLRSLAKVKLNKNTDLATVVVDNGSEDDSVQAIRKEFPKVIIIENQKNLGFTGGCNEGARVALKSGGDYVLFLNNDTLVHKDLIKNLLSAAENDSVGGVVPKIYFEKGYEFNKNKYKVVELGKVIWYAGGIMDWENLIGKNVGVDEVDRGQFDVSAETEIATGCCFMVRSDVLSKVGLYDDKYFLYYEDADLSQRIKNAGFKIIYEPKAILWHKNAESSGGSGSDLQDYYISRNRMLFGTVYAPLKTKIALFRESLKLLKNGRPRQKKGVCDFYLRRFGKGSFSNGS